MQSLMLEKSESDSLAIFFTSIYRNKHLFLTFSENIKNEKKSIH